MAVVGVHVWKKGNAPLSMFHSRSSEYRLWSQMDLVSDPLSATFPPMTLGKMTFPSWASFLTPRKELQSRLTVVRMTGEGTLSPAHGGGWAVSGSIPPLLSVFNLFPCRMQLKVYDVLKPIFQFRSNKL